ncbi:uncharacterized protein [Halyomorpha halys]|uniref:uncharacterized protein n=1 Tax=Halyomorpha halys TaxID=286706 RepID=UPI0006D526D1|nr:uncharacterized protein LOC106682976 [Halyomorpha halys]
MSTKKEEKGKECKKKRGVLKPRSREMIVNVRKYFEAEKLTGGPLIPIDQVVARTAAACHLPQKLVSKIMKKERNKTADTKIPTPAKRRPRGISVDSSQQKAIRMHIYAYYEREDYPTKKRLVASLYQTGLFTGNATTLSYTLKKLGFSWRKIRNNRKLLMERIKYQAWRGRFIRDILSASLERIIWLGETCVNSDHFKKRRSGETTNVLKRFALILINAGGIEGFVPNATLTFRGKKCSDDFHSDISQLTFKHWFKEKLIPNIKPQRIIVMDDAPYHNVHNEKYPTRAQSKEEIMAWLKSKNIKFDPTMFKLELLQIVKQQKPRYPIYEIDEIAKEQGHRVLRIPPKHSHFSPIEIIWTQIKDYIAENSDTFKISEVTKLIEEKIKIINSQDWGVAILHAMEEIRIQEELDHILDERIDNMIHSTKSSSEMGESDYTDEESSDGVVIEVEDFSPPERKPFETLLKTTLSGDSSIDDSEDMDIGIPCKQELGEDEKIEVKKEEDSQQESSRTFFDSLDAKQKKTVSSNDDKELGETGKQEFVDWNLELKVKKE